MGKIRSNYKERDNMGQILDNPTQCIPGSDAKVSILEQRRIKWMNLWHPDDLKMTELMKKYILKRFEMYMHQNNDLNKELGMKMATNDLETLRVTNALEFNKLL